MTNTATLAPANTTEHTENIDATGPDFLPELNLGHRCDACSAAAVAQVEISDTLPHLLLCGHHFRKNRAAFIESGYAYSVPDDYDYTFTDREIAKRPRVYGARDAGSSPA